MKYKHALITGASSGLGRALAIDLASAGVFVTIVGRSLERLEETKLLAADKTKDNVCVVEADLSDRNEVSGLVARAQAQHPEQLSVDLLVNNAGFVTTGLFEDIPIDELENSLKLNFIAGASLIQQALPAMKSNQFGKIVNISSGVANRAIPYAYPYCAAKSALASMSESLCVELKGSGVSVLSFSPGPLETPFVDRSRHFGKLKIKGPEHNGQKVEQVSKKILSAIKANKTRVLLGQRAAVAKQLNHFAPNWVDGMLKRAFHLESDS